MTSVPDPLPRLTMPDGLRQKLHASFEFRGLSGFHWFVYRRISEPRRTPE